MVRQIDQATFDEEQEAFRVLRQNLDRRLGHLRQRRLLRGLRAQFVVAQVVFGEDAEHMVNVGSVQFAQLFGVRDVLEFVGWHAGFRLGLGPLLDQIHTVSSTTALFLRNEVLATATERDVQRLARVLFN